MSVTHKNVKFYFTCDYLRFWFEAMIKSYPSLILGQSGIRPYDDSKTESKLIACKINFNIFFCVSDIEKNISTYEILKAYFCYKKDLMCMNGAFE
jgi:hypothetical protein